MNKYQDALNSLVRISCPKKTSCIECNFENKCNCEAKEYINLLQELVDKADEQDAISNTGGLFPLYFKLHSDSTLKSQTKDYLIDYIHVLYHNWGVCEESFYNVMRHANTLDEALDKACEQLEKVGGLSDYYDRTSFMDKGKWKQWCLKDE